MSSRVYELPEEDWVLAIGQYLANKYPEVPDKATLIVAIKRRTRVMTVRIEE